MKVEKKKSRFTRLCDWAFGWQRKVLEAQASVIKIVVKEEKEEDQPKK